MLDINLIRNSPKIIEKDLKKRKDKEKIKLFNDLVEKDILWRKKKKNIEDLKHDRNVITKEINELKKSGKKADKKIKEASEISSQIKTDETLVEELYEEMKKQLMRLPNLMDSSVPIGDDDTQNVEVKRFGNITEKDFEIKNHGELLESINLADFDQAAKVSGAGFNFLIGDAAKLSRALSQLAIDYLIEKGYKLVETPLMIHRAAYEGAVDLSDFESVMYKIDNEDLYLIATSEHSMNALFEGKVVAEESLPIKLIALTPCFRKEIGSRGVDTKGIFRVHQFYKLEQFIICKPEDSSKFHEELINNAIEITKKIEVPFRQVNICTGDLGTVASKKYDLECWSPRQKKFIETHSGSNCTDYQARRSNIKYGKYGGEKAYPHTLNCTAMAVGRMMVVLLENHQNMDGSINIPKALRPYMGGQTRIVKKEAKK